MKCRYGCPQYGKSGSCPPEVPGIESCKNLISEYSKALVLRFSPGEPRLFEKPILDIEKSLFLEGKYRAFGFFVSPCTACEECSPQECKSPEKSRPTPEAFGIDLFETARKAGFEMDILREKGNFSPVGLVLVE
jgi:predicted metal-binding protein